MKTVSYMTRYESPIGVITLESDGEFLIGLRFEDYLENDDVFVLEDDGLPVFEQARQWLDCYFGSHAPGFTLPLRLEGTPFRKRVWKILQTIPFGETRTYGEIAALIAAERDIPKMAAQAVGGAVSQNPIALIVPCHRVLGSDGNLTGYAGGLERKAWLLDLERTTAAPQRP